MCGGCVAPWEWKHIDLRLQALRLILLDSGGWWMIAKPSVNGFTHERRNVVQIRENHACRLLPSLLCVYFRAEPRELRQEVQRAV